MSTAFLTHPLFNRYTVPNGHPECPQRVSAISDELHAQGIYDLLQIVAAPAASVDELCRVHTADYVSRLESLVPESGFVALDPDTYLGPDTLAAAKHAAGAAIEATDRVLGGQADNAFCCVRPPGHHAGRATAMGFCYFNNVAVGVAHAFARHGLERIAILDFDVHHGNGTEEIFANDGRVLICSSFQHPYYPHTGWPVQASNTINVPLPAGCDGQAFRDALVGAWLPAIELFSPQLIFLSAGFDGHAEDSLAQLRLEVDDYRWVSDWIVALARRYAGGRIVSCLEGGYALPALARSAAAHIRSLAGL